MKEKGNAYVINLDTNIGGIINDVGLFPWINIINLSFKKKGKYNNEI